MECICVPVYVNMGAIEPAAALELQGAPIDAALAGAHILNEVLERQAPARAGDDCGRSDGDDPPENVPRREERRVPAVNRDDHEKLPGVNIPPHLPQPVKRMAVTDRRPAIAPEPVASRRSTAVALGVWAVHAWIVLAFSALAVLVAQRIWR